MTDPERIYLEPGEGDPMEGRQWCQDNVWADDGMYDEEATAYVRGDLYDDLSDQLAKSEAENARLRKCLGEPDPPTAPAGTYEEEKT